MAAGHGAVTTVAATEATMEVVEEVDLYEAADSRNEETVPMEVS